MKLNKTVTTLVLALIITVRSVPSLAVLNGSCSEDKARFGGVARLSRFDDEGNRSSFCSGVLISDTALLTAAHCFPAGTTSTLLAVHVQQQNSTITDCVTFKTATNECSNRVFDVRIFPGHKGPDSEDTVRDIAVVHIKNNKMRFQNRDLASSDFARLYSDVWQKSRDQLRTGYGPCNKRGAGSGIYRQKDLRINGDFFDLHYRDRARRHSRGCEGDSGGPAFLRASSQLRPVVVGLFSNSEQYEVGTPKCSALLGWERWVKISPKVQWISDTLENLTGKGCRDPFRNVDGFKYKICFD